MKNNLGIKELHIDKANYTPIATVKQEDNITMTLELYKDGEAFDITRQTVTLAAKRSDKIIVEQIDGFSIDANSLTIELKNNINAKIGLVYLELNIKDETGSMTTLDFYLKVVGKIMGEDNLDASDNIASLEKIQDEFIKSSNALLDTVTKSENTRVDAEILRESNEKTRGSSETNRATAETKRVEAENLRKTAETSRDEAEKIRAAADALRDEKVEKFGSQVTKNKNDIADNAKDIERAFNVINDNSFIPFEGENVTVEHSKVGFTKDIQIEGMTYQNLALNKLVDGTYNPEGTYTQTNIPNGVKLIRGTGVSQWVYLGCRMNSNLLKYNQVYTIIFKLDYSSKALINEKRKTIAFQEQTSSNNIGVSETFICKKGTIITKLKTTTDINRKIGNQFFYMTMGESDFGAEGEWVSVSDIVILEGDYTNSYIPPYFEGIKSVGEKENKISILSNNANYFKLSKDNIKGYKTTVNVEGNSFTVSTTTGWAQGFDINVNKIPDGKYKIVAKNLPNKNLGVIYALDYYKGNILVKHTVLNELTFSIENIDYDYFQLRFKNCIEISSIGYEYFMIVPFDYNKTEYVEKKIDKKEISLPFSDGLKSLPNGVKDIIYNKDDGCYVRKNIERKILNGTENWREYESGSNEKYIRFVASNVIQTVNQITDNLICDRFTGYIHRSNTPTQEGIFTEGSSEWNIQIYIERNKLETQDIIGFKKWLSQNPVEVYYELAEPIETKITDLNSINLETFKDVTYVSSENEIQPNLSFKAPVDISKTIGSLRNANAMLIAKNAGLENKNTELEKVNNQQNKALKELNDTTTFLIEDSLSK